VLDLGLVVDVDVEVIKSGGLAFICSPSAVVQRVLACGRTWRRCWRLKRSLPSRVSANSFASTLSRCLTSSHHFLLDIPQNSLASAEHFYTNFSEFLLERSSTPP
jgi:hypothetical protein